MEKADDKIARNAVVMGADRDLGAAIALALAEAGWDIAAASTTGDSAEAFEMRGLVRRIEALGRRAMLEAIDQANGANVQVGMRQIAKQLGSVDLLVTTPGPALLRATERMSDAEWSRAVGYNLSALFFACRAAAREMLDAVSTPKGRIVVLLPGVEPQDGASVMLATRAAAEALVQAFAAEWAPRGIAVNAIALPPDAASLHDQAVATVLRLAGAAESGEIVVLPR
ncbi:MAG TPA: SDR family NAD(P)-dependent oxidoreductase [Dehalococcoidia bacterium]|nr:SDR family NAD(P)-dependent oxidoreductase [Dehalococcoidia bacterium]